MAIWVDIYISDVVGIISSGYDKIKVYSSYRRDTDYSETTSPTTRLSIDVTTARYTYSDTFGTADTWYKWSYYSSITLIESSLSSPIRGSIIGEFYRERAYPPERDLTTAEQDMIYRVRQYIGDIKEVNHDYLSPTTSYDNVSVDRYTIELDNPKGWPLNIAIDGVSYSTIVDPVVRGYQFVTFSGTQISTTSGIADIWYEHFRFSDREILDAYNALELITEIPYDMTTAEMYEISAAIKLLELELRNFLATSSSSVSIYEEISINPEAGISARQIDLKSLKDRLRGLIDIAISNNLTMFGVRID